MHKRVLIAGTNDIATASAQRLFRCGFLVTILSEDIALDLYYQRNYSPVLVSGSKVIDQVKAQSYADFIYNLTGNESKTLPAFVEYSFNNRQIAVLSRGDLKKISISYDYGIICEDALFDAIHLNKSNMTLISCVAGKHAAAGYNIILNGPRSGQVSYPFLEYETADMPQQKETLKATQAGVFIAHKIAGDRVVKGETIAMLGDTVVKAGRTGYIAGIIRSGVIVAEGQQIASVEESLTDAVRELPQSALAISGAVLEAIMYDIHLNS
jgi:hypothetical protein